MSQADAGAVAETVAPHGSSWLRALDAALDLIVGVALFGELAVIIADVLGRTLFDEPLLWTDEVANLALTTIAFIGGAVAYRRNQHIAVRFLVDQMPRSWREPVHAGADWFVLLVAVLCFFPSIGLLRTRWDELTPILELPAAWLAMPLTIGMVLMVIYALARLAAQPRRAVLISMLAVAMLTAAAVVWYIRFGCRC